MTSIEHIPSISFDDLTTSRVLSLFFTTLTQPITLLVIQDTEFDFLKFYHNWANCLGIVAFSLMVNASESGNTSYDFYIRRFFEAAISASVLGNLVFWFLVDEGIYQRVVKGREVEIDLMELILKVFVVFVPMICLIIEFCIDKIEFSWSYCWSSGLEPKSMSCTLMLNCFNFSLKLAEASFCTTFLDLIYYLSISTNGKLFASMTRAI